MSGSSPGWARKAIAAVMLVIVAVQPARLPAADPGPPPGLPWGELTDGLQLSLSTGVNTDAITARDKLLSMMLTIRNGSDQPAPLNTELHGYEFEYEIDGTWYAFEAIEPVPTSNSLIRDSITATAANHPDLRTTIAPGSLAQTVLSIPVSGRSASQQLHAIGTESAVRVFEAKPGTHVVRVRTGRVLDATRRAPVSNTVTVTLPPADNTSRQTVTFGLLPDIPLRDLRFADGPPDGESFFLRVIARPPQPFVAPGLVNAAALQVLPPMPFHDLRLPRTRGGPDPALPATTGIRRYFVRSGAETVASIDLSSTRHGLALHAVSSPATADPLFRALLRLAAMEEVRSASYEPRLLRVMGTRGMPTLTTLWLHSSSGKPDLFYWPRDPALRGSTQVESDKLYQFGEFLAAATALPVTPIHDEAWAIAAASECTGKVDYGTRLFTEKAVAEVGVSDKQDRVVWYVFIPGEMPPDMIITPAPGAALLVDEADASCKTVMRE